MSAPTRTRIAYRVRNVCSGDWALVHPRTGIMGGVLVPQEFRSPVEARHAARFLRRKPHYIKWRLVKVTIITRSKKK